MKGMSPASIFPSIDIQEPRSAKSKPGKASLSLKGGSALSATLMELQADPPRRDLAIAH
jgi:hypothetical protein